MTRADASAPSTTPDFDVLIIGAGISGIGAAYHLQRDCPDRSYAILEGRSDLGGTWSLFTYPGVRSDSDMHTLGYSFKPWTGGKSLADGPSILDYLRETVAEHGIERHIRFDHLCTTARWSTDTSTWTVEASHEGESVSYTCNFLFMCSGYYSYKGGHRPDFPGEERFAGPIIHPQEWPDDLDHADKKVVVIGSGATAVTLVPAMAETARHVTMLQRTPSYVVSTPAVDPIAKTLKRFMPTKRAYAATRFKNIKMGNYFYRRTRTKPDAVKKMVLGRVEKALGEEMTAEHFTPPYNPWDQRMCLIPDGDLFEALTSGKASVVTDHIATFTESGIELESGDRLEADIIVTATGLQLVTLGEMDFFVDGEQVDFADTWSWHGMGYSDVPNLISSFGYINASWTLRADLTCGVVTRLLNHMRATGTTQCTPRLRGSDADMPARPLIEDFSSGYMQRSMHLLPKQGDREPWINCQDYVKELTTIGEAPVDDGCMTFTGTPVLTTAS